VCKKRKTLVHRDGFKSYSLKNIVKTLGLDDVGKGDIDYSIFSKTVWTPEEQALIVKYLKQDLLLTYKLWKYMVARFEPFAEFLSEKDASRYKHITASSGSYAYKVICKMTGMLEEYNDAEDKPSKFVGGFVSVPVTESARGTIVALDFASLYPSMFIQFNLYSHTCECCKDSEKFSGNSMFSVTGKYCVKRQGIIEQTLMRLYSLRMHYKKLKDSREGVVKIIINTMYGISGSPVFHSLYNLNTAKDCTGLGQQCIKYARKELSNAGYTVLYSDTDSAYILLPEGKTLTDIKEFSRSISNTLSENTVFPWKEFDFKIDEVIKYICFFKGHGDTLNKKHYLYVTNDDKLVLKGISLVQCTCSRLSLLIFENELRQRIISGLECKFEESFIRGLILKYLAEDVSLAACQFNVKGPYTSKTSIQSQIYEMLGSGEHYLVKNHVGGAGKKVKYCTLKDAKNLRLEDIDISVFLSELSPFIKEVN
jgi:DNA polymerase elongation subunit (family B)